MELEIVKQTFKVEKHHKRNVITSMCKLKKSLSRLYFLYFIQFKPFI